MAKAETNKTIIPGIADRSSIGGGDGIYGRSDVSAQGKTYIPNIYSQVAGGQEKEAKPAGERSLCLQDRVIAGVLFSVSHLYIGEMFPVYIGRNTIGSGKDCDIRLKEESVSANHAVLLIRNIENGYGQTEMTASITDYDSEYGTKVGGEPLGFDKKVCHDHDIISIGNSYRLLLCLFDTETYGMTVDENFMLLWTPEDDMPEQQQDTGRMEPMQPYPQETINEVTAGSESIPDFYKPSRKAKKKQQANETVVNKVMRKNNRHT